MNEFDSEEIFDDIDDGMDSTIINKYAKYTPTDKTLFTNVTLWDRIVLWWKYGIKLKQL